MYRKPKIRFLLIAFSFIMIFNSFTLIAAFNSGEGHVAGTVNMKDIFRLRQYLAGYDIDIDMEMADVNKDGVVDYDDVLALRQYLAGIPVDFPQPGPLMLLTDDSGVFSGGVYPMMINPVLEVQVSQNVVLPGEYVYVDIYMSVNPGLAVLDFTLGYDSRLEVSQVQRHDDFSSTFHMNLIEYPYPNPLRFGMESISLQNVDDTGIISRIRFHVRGDADPGNDNEQLAHFTLDSEVFAGSDGTKFMPTLENNYVRIVESHHGIQLGDVNGDGVVNTADALLLTRYAFGHAVSLNDIRAGDVNCDGVINTADALLLTRYAFGHSVTLGCGHIDCNICG